MKALWKKSSIEKQKATSPDSKINMCLFPLKCAHALLIIVRATTSLIVQTRGENQEDNKNEEMEETKKQKEI